jgi:hypothetical protein
MAEASRRAARAKLDNALFVQAAIEAPPPELAGAADAITVNYPWGALLKAFVTPEPRLLANLAALGREGASVTVLVNMSVFDDAAYGARIGLPHPPVLADPERTRGLYAAAGLAVTSIDPSLASPPYRTTWGRKLVKSGRRRILRLDVIVRRGA